MQCVTRLSVPLTVDVVPDSPCIALPFAEETLLECLGGQGHGVLEAQLFADSLGRITLTRANIWVVDKSADGARMCASLERHLTNIGAGAAIITSRFCAVTSTRILDKEVLQGSTSPVLSIDEVASVIANAAIEREAMPNQMMGGRQLRNAQEQPSEDGYTTIYNELANGVRILVIHATFGAPRPGARASGPWFRFLVH